MNPLVPMPTPPESRPRVLDRWMARTWFLTPWCTIAAFGTYACMYAFRKPFTAGQYVDPPFADGLKSWLVLAQVLGYTLSKFVGIRVISEMPPPRRSLALLALISAALAALVLFAVVPTSLKPACLFFNGLPLGMVYGLILGFLEGRRLTEAFIAGLCSSFILADGFTKSVGKALLDLHVTEAWMPAVAGTIFFLPLVGFVAMLRRIPAPSLADRAERSNRTPMVWADRRAFFAQNAPGLVGLLAMYLLVTVLRNIRADFAPELWSSLGAQLNSALYTRSELWVAVGVLLLHSLLAGVRNNRRAFFIGWALSLSGILVLASALIAQWFGAVAAFPFVVLIGVGLYLPYVAAHTTLFERLMAMTQSRGNLGYLMYLADAVGYLGYAAVIAVRQFGRIRGDFLTSFLGMSWVVVAGSALGLGLTLGFYTRKRFRDTDGPG